MEAIADLIIQDVVANYSAYTIPVWQPKRIKHVMSLISEDIANSLDYTDANKFAQSVARSLDIDILPYIVKNKYPVWVDYKDEIKPIHKNAIVTYIEEIKEEHILLIERMKNYADSISADFIPLSGRTQGYVELELHRIKTIAETYERTLFISINTYIKNTCPNIFNEVPDGFIGIYDNNEDGIYKHKHDKKIFLLKAEAFTRTQIIDSNVDNSVKYELDLMRSNYDNNVVLCNKKDADIWSPFTFPYRFSKDENRAWMEILIYRNGKSVFPLSKTFNYSIFNRRKSENKQIIRYEYVNTGDNVIHTYLDDNCIIGYKEKDPVNMMDFKVLSLYHTEDQRNSIENRGYLEFIDLNNIGSKFDNSFTESRIYYQSFDYLFPQEFKYVGLTTGSWNIKYVGLNPIDRLHDWAAIRRLEENTILCSDLEPTERFYRERKSLLHNVFNEITFELITEFLSMIGLPTKYEHKYAPVSNQIIAKREIVKSLFDFYQSNEILDKIEFFIRKHNLTVKNSAYGGNAYERRSGFFAETATSLWINYNNFSIMPQEILRQDWYK